MKSRLLLVLMLVSFGATFCAVSARQKLPESKSQASAKALLDVAKKGLELVERPIPMRGVEPYVRVSLWSKRVRDAELALSHDRSERIAAREKYLKQTLKLERIARQLHEQELMSDEQLLDAEYNRCEAQAQLDADRDATLQAHQ
jgi:hypothetical protein